MKRILLFRTICVSCRTEEFQGEKFRQCIKHKEGRVRMGCRDGSFTENDLEKFDINPILRQISPLGRFQWIQLFLAFVITLATGLTIVTYAFTG